MSAAAAAHRHDIPAHDPEPRPLLRGAMHLVVALLAPAGLVLLLLLADSPRRYVGASIFAASLMLLYTTSASYHIAPWSDRLRAVMKRADHAMIFVLIAGTYTPLCLVVLSTAWGISILSLVWTLAGLGVLLVIAWPSAPRWVTVAPYLAVGWVGVLPISQVLTNMPPLAITMLAAGGALYTVGAVVYARRKPNPFPRVFGFHEVFHTFVVAGTALHFTLIAIYVVR
jgi:hemolysin III